MTLACLAYASRKASCLSSLVLFSGVGLVLISACGVSAVRCPPLRVIPVLLELPLTNNRLGHTVLGSQLAEGYSPCFVVLSNLLPFHIAHADIPLFILLRNIFQASSAQAIASVKTSFPPKRITCQPCDSI